MDDDQPPASRSTSRSTSRSSSRSSSASCSATSTPRPATAMKPLGDGFIKLIKMIIAPIIFCTVVVGIAGMEDMKKVGKTGGLGAALLRGRQHARAGRRPARSSTSCSRAPA